MRPIDADKILSDFPIRYDHYDKENGSEDFILGIETVMEYIDCIADEHPLDLSTETNKRRTKTMKIELKPCPFCGCECKTAKKADGAVKIIGRHRLSCIFSELMWRGGYLCKEDAAKEWNKRVGEEDDD